jgi:hypothetical protein
MQPTPVCVASDGTVQRIKATLQPLLQLGQRGELHARGQCILLCGGDAMEMWETPGARIDGLIFRASRAEVETGRTEGILTLLRKLLNPDVALRARGRLILIIDGYDDDKRELYMIPEVREWIREVDREFPYWLFFMDLGPRSTLAFVMFALCRYERVSGGSRIPDQELNQFLLARFAAMNGLATRLNIPQRDIDAWSREIGRFFA